MKILIIHIIILVLSVQPFFAQEKQSMHIRALSYKEKAEQSILEYDFEKAVTYYQKALKKEEDSTAIELSVASCYTRLGETDKAEEWYIKAFSIADSIGDEYILEFASILIANGKLEEAREHLNKYKESVNEDIRTGAYLGTIDNINKYYRDSTFYLVENVKSVNSEVSDINPVSFKNHLYFVSRRRTSPEAFSNSFYNIFISDLSSEGEVLNIRSVSKILNTYYHEGPISIDSLNNKIYFTRNIPDLDKKSKSKLGIYVAHLDQDKNVSEQQPVIIEDFNFNTGHPCLNSKGDILYFISDAGYGGVDLFKSQFKDNKWCKPENLGEKINTKGDEMFPFLLNDSILYFASNGHGGLGGMDIFKVDLNDSSLIVVNLGYPINSSADDFSLFINKGGESGYFSSNRGGGKGSDDIYKIDIVHIKIKGTILDATLKNTLKDARIKLLSSDGSEKEVNSNEDGLFEFELSQKNDYSLLIEKDDYLPQEVSIDSLLNTNTTIKSIALELNMEMELIPDSDTLFRTKGSDQDLLHFSFSDGANVEDKYDLREQEALEELRFLLNLSLDVPDSGIDSSKIIRLEEDEFSFQSDIPYELTIYRKDKDGVITDSVQMDLARGIQYDFNSQQDKKDYIQSFNEKIKNLQQEQTGDVKSIDVDLVFKDLMLDEDQGFSIKLKPSEDAGLNYEEAETRIITREKTHRFKANDQILISVPLNDPANPLSIRTNLDQVFEKDNLTEMAFSIDTLNFFEGIEVDTAAYYKHLRDEDAKDNSFAVEMTMEQKMALDEIRYILDLNLDVPDSGIDSSKIIRLEEDEFSFLSDIPYELTIYRKDKDGVITDSVQMDLARSIQYDFNSQQDKKDYIQSFNEKLKNLKQEQTGDVKSIDVDLVFKDLMLDDDQGFSIKLKPSEDAGLNYEEAETRIITREKTHRFKANDQILISVPLNDPANPLSIRTNLDQVFEKDNLTEMTFSIDTLNFFEGIEVDTRDYFRQINNEFIPGTSFTKTSDIKYRVQIAASRRRISQAELKRIYDGPLEIKEFEEDDYYKYFIVDAPTYFEAKQFLNESDVKGCFIVAYIDGEKKTLREAMTIQYKEQMTKSGSIVRDSIINMVTVNFDLNDYHLRADEENYLDELVVKQLMDNSEYYAVVNGHTDVQGSDVYNMALSEERADFVKKILIRKGVEENRIATFSYGESLLLKICNSPDGCDDSVHRVNRRVEIILFKPKN